MPRVWADNAGGGGSGIADPGGANDDLLQKKSGAWTNRTPAQVATDLGVDGKVSKSGDTMTGYLTTPGVYGVDVGGGYKALDIADSLDHNASAFLGSDGYITLTDNVNGAYLNTYYDGNIWAGANIITPGGFLSAPKFMSVPASGSKTLTLTTDDCGIVVIDYAPASGGIIKLPSLPNYDVADFLIVNYTSYAVATKAQGTNSIVHLAGGTGDWTLASRTAVRLSLYGYDGGWYQVAPEA